MTDSVVFMSSSFAMVDKAGAMMVDTMILLNPVADSTLVTRNFLSRDQSRGFWDSKVGEKVTRNGSSCVNALVVSGSNVSFPPSSKLDGDAIISERSSFQYKGVSRGSKKLRTLLEDFPSRI